MSDRQIVSEARLRQILNEEIEKREECAGCEILGSIKKLPEAYADGGNWNRSLTIRGRPRDPQACGETAADIICEIAAHYNIE